MAAALGNAALVGVGYWMMRRRWLGAAAVSGTLVLLVLLLAVGRGWVEIVTVVWWAAMVGHGWRLAGGRVPGVETRRSSRHDIRGAAQSGAPAAGPGAAQGAEHGDLPVAGLDAGQEAGRGGGRTVQSQRVAAAAAAVPVLLVAGLLRWDALHTAHSMVAARDGGDCAKVLKAAGGVWFGMRIGDGPAVAHGDRIVRECRALRGASARLRDGLGGDTAALADGFATMSRVLGEPGTAKVVGVTLDGFLRGLPTPDPCHTATVTDWLRVRGATHDALGRSAAVVPRVAPAALLGCGDDLMNTESWKPARTRYQQLLDQYPKDQRAGKAKDGVHKATLKIELAHVKDLLDTVGDEQPKYCSAPAKYSGADAYGKGTNHALFYGNDHYTDKLPHGWKADGPEDAQVIVCAGDDKDGPSAQTCPYVSHSSISLDHTTYVTFHEIAIPVKVYELRTGKLVEHRTVNISGSSCPPHLSYTYYNGLDTGPDSDQYVRPSTGDVRSAFDSLINR